MYKEISASESIGKRIKSIKTSILTKSMVIVFDDKTFTHFSVDTDYEYEPLEDAYVKNTDIDLFDFGVVAAIESGIIADENEYEEMYRIHKEREE